MARKRNTAPDPMPPAPDAEAANPSPPAPAEPSAPKVVDTKVVDMPVRDLLQMLGCTLPETVPVQPRPIPALPPGIDTEAKLVDLTVGDLIQLLAAF